MVGVGVLAGLAVQVEAVRVGTRDREDVAVRVEEAVRSGETVGVGLAHAEEVRVLVQVRVCRIREGPVQVLEAESVLDHVPEAGSD